MLLHPWFAPQQTITLPPVSAAISGTTSSLNARMPAEDILTDGDIHAPNDPLWATALHVRHSEVLYLCIGTVKPIALIIGCNIVLGWRTCSEVVVESNTWLTYLAGDSAGRMHVLQQPTGSSAALFVPVRAPQQLHKLGISRIRIHRRQNLVATIGFDCTVQVQLACKLYVNFHCRMAG